MKTPACRTSRELVGVQNSLKNFDLDPVAMPNDLDICDHLDHPDCFLDTM